MEWRHYLKVQSWMWVWETNPWEAHRCHKAFGNNQTLPCDNIRNRGWRGSTLSSSRRGPLGVKGPVSSSVDACVVQERLVLFAKGTVASGPGASPRMPPTGWRWGVTQPKRRLSALGPCFRTDHRTTTTRTTPRTRRLSGFLALLHVAPCHWQESLLQTTDTRANCRYRNLDSFHLRSGNLDAQSRQTSWVQDLYVADPASGSPVCFPP